MVYILIYVGLLIGAALLNRLSWTVLAIYLLASLITFVVYAWDKSAARRSRWRTSESTLHILALIGGWPGGLAAQKLLRHKSSKQAFLTVFWVTVMLNIAAIGYLAWQGQASSINRLLDIVGQFRLY